MPTDAQALVIEILLHDDRWHGDGEWPPSPFRLFQALVAAAARGARLEQEDRQALEWLEALEPPTIATPRHVRSSRAVQAYVPNNDLDAVDGDPDLVERIRAPKRIQPRLLSNPPHFLYVWRFTSENNECMPSRRLVQIAHRLYQFGRGIDMAWARAHVLALDEAEDMLRRHPGSVHSPCANGNGRLSVPVRGSLRSLERRFDQFRSRLMRVQDGRRMQIHFRQPSKPVRRTVSYACPPHRLLYDIRMMEQPERFAPVMQREIAPLVKRLRDLAAARLREAGVQEVCIERYLVGRGADAQDKKRRVRIIPLPSIGHEFAGGGIRRVLVEVPQDSPLDNEDTRWAFEGLSWGEKVDPETGELTGGHILVESADTRMLRNYGIERQDGTIHWQTVTPAALPVHRRGKAGSNRLSTEKRAIKAVQTALRHADVRARPVRIRVQREPFDRNSRMAGDYDPDRFETHELWHVEIVFDAPVSGPLIIGNGRYLGMGLMAPCPPSDAYVLPLEGEGVPERCTPAFVEAARRAMIATASHLFGDPVEPFFHGHEENS
ncbi:MAG: type I-U CRISPR-associated protein Cas5/Cas6, partial [Chloroflexi bacterium]